MRKFIALMAVLLVMAVTAKAQTQPINVVCDAPRVYDYGTDAQYALYSTAGDYLFVFDIYYAPGASDIVDGQTYTLADMDADYSYGQDLYGDIDFASASYTRSADGSVVADVTDTDGQQYHITYTVVPPIDEPTDTIVVDMTTNPDNRAFDLISDMGVIQLMGYSNANDYMMNVVFNTTQFAGSYTIADKYQDDQYFMLYSVDAQGNKTSVPCNNLLEATVTGTASNCTAHIKWVAADGTMYDISFAYADPIAQTQQTFTATDLTITEDPMSDIYAQYYGYYVFSFQASNGTEILSGELHPIAKSPLGTWTLDNGDIDFNLYDATTGVASSSPFSGTITIAQPQDGVYTLTGTSLFYDNVEWTFNCTSPLPITNPTDTVVVDMTSDYNNRAFDLISGMGAIQLIGHSNDGYLMNVVFNTTQFAGSYTIADRYEDDDFFMLYSNYDSQTGGTPIPCNNLLEATVTGTASNCTAHIKWVAADGTMYDISFAYADPTVQSQQTFVATDLTITQNPNYALYQMYYDVYAYDFQASDGTNTLHGTVFNKNADDALGTWTFDDGNTLDFNLYDATTGVASSSPFSGTITIAQAQDSSYTLTGTSLFYDNVEWTFNCSFVIVPEDTVAIVMDNEEVNMVYDHTTDGEDYFTLYGADQNVEYLFQLGVYASGQMAGTYTQNDVELEATTLIHFTETDTTTVEIAEVRDFTVLGDSTSCSTYIEILSTDLVLYKITYTYGNAPEPPVSVDNVNETEFVIVSENNAIVVYTAEGEDIMVCDMAGRIIMNGKTASDVERINVAVPGVYVVRIGNRAVNVLVK